MRNTSGDFITLASDRLSVEIAVPGAFYKGSRFDWNGFITQVTLDGIHTFCIPESLEEGKGSGGCGLCGEFCIHEPVGYDEAAVGGYFPKIGVGNILKTDNSGYDFFKKQDFTPYKTLITKNKNGVEFHVTPENCNGYSLLYKKKISVEDSCIKAEYYLRNIGSKAVHTTEYCHNFIRIDNETVGRGYTLRLPYLPLADNLPVQMEYAGNNALTWKDEDWQNSFYTMIKGYDQENGHSWELYNRTKGAGIREYDDFKPARFVLWGMRHVISPEIFIDINLQPDEELRWTRRYEFFISG